MKKNYGFTLAEVLITLAIIGVVAAMTVPTLMTSTRGKEYEVGAAKALSTLANSITMRIALEGVAPANFSGSIGQFLLQPPGLVSSATGRPGEQPALPTTFIGNGAGASATIAANATNTNMFSATLKDGMIVMFNGGAASDTTSNPTGVAMANAAASGCSNTTNGCLILIDTNGVKGPTRTNPGAIPMPLPTNTAAASGGCGATGITGDCANNATTTQGNIAPDIIQLRLRDTVVEPANQRTRNILATGNATISQ